MPADFRKAGVGGKANVEGYLWEAVQLYSIRRCGLALAADMLRVERPTVIAFSARWVRAAPSAREQVLGANTA